VFIGFVKHVTNDYIEVKINTEAQVDTGDSLRFQKKSGREGRTVKVKKTSLNDGVLRCHTEDTSRISKKDSVYIAGRKNPLLKKWKKKRVDINPARYKTRCPVVSTIMSKYVTDFKKSKFQKESRLFIRVADLNWLDIVKKHRCSGFILGCELKELQNIINNRKMIRNFIPKIIISLPPYIPEKDIYVWRKTLSDLRKAGVDKFMCAHPGQMNIMPENSKKYADSTIWCINKATQKALKDMDYSAFIYSPEDDILNLKTTGSSHGMITLFSHIPLFISRINPPIPVGSSVSEDRDKQVFTVNRHGLWYVLGQKPLCLTHRRERIIEAGIGSFILDFSFSKPEKKLFNTVITHYENNRRMQETSLFNHKGGLF
jgi:hypothetical protein